MANNHPEHGQRIQKPRPRFRAAAVAVATALAAASCGIGGASASSGLSELQKSRIAEEWRDCMAAGGLTNVELQYDNGIDIGVEIPEGIPEEQVLEIEAGCESILEQLDASFELDPNDQATLIDASADLEKCLADAGYVVTMSDGGVELNSEDQSEGFDEAAYLEVETACYKEIVPELYEKYGGE